MSSITLATWLGPIVGAIVGAVVGWAIRKKQKARDLRQLIPLDFINAIEHHARKAEEDSIRIACAHTAWSCRPDRAKPILEDALRDLNEHVRMHAKTLLAIRREGVS